MNEIVLKIRRDINEGYIEEAIKKTLQLAQKKGYKEQINYLHLLSSRLKKHKREYFGGLTNDKIENNQIVYSLLSIIDSIIEINEPISKSKKKEKFYGKIWFLNNEQHFGFIKSPNFENEIFFHFSAVFNKKHPRIKNKVKFELDKNLKGWYAPKVELLIPPRPKRKKTRKTKEQKKQINKLQQKELIENDVRFFFQRIETIILKIINKLFKT